MLENIGEIDYPDDANIPVVCFLNEPDPNDEYHPNKWIWSASNFMPRKEAVCEGYELIADTKEEIMEYINKYVVPLYEVALKKLKACGENYYWQEEESS